MRYTVRYAIVAGSLGVLVGATSAVAQDWPNWRGPNHDGISSETNLITKWDAAPPVVWKHELGSAFSAFACVDGKAYTCGTREKQQVLFCLDADTGEILWQKPFEKEYRERQGGDGTRATPTVSDGRVYVHGALGRLICFDAKDGNELWSRQLGAKPRWGYSGSVLIEGDLAIVAAGGSDGALAAVDKQTGKPIWQCGNDAVSYATPYPFTLEGRRYVVGMLAKVTIIADVETGREVWRRPWETSWDVNAATPIFHDGHLFLSSGYKHGAILVKLTRSGDQLDGTTVWENKAIRAKFQSPVLYEGHLYTSDEIALKCVDFASGELKWSQRDIKHGTVVVADGHLFVLTERGELLIGKATPEASGFEPTTRVPILSGRCWTVPTLYKGRLYARNLKQAVCLKLRR